VQRPSWTPSWITPFCPTSGMSTQVFFNLLWVPYSDQESKLGDIWLHTGPPQPPDYMYSCGILEYSSADKKLYFKSFGMLQTKLDAAVCGCSMIRWSAISLDHWSTLCCGPSLVTVGSKSARNSESSFEVFRRFLCRKQLLSSPSSTTRLVSCSNFIHATACKMWQFTSL